MTYRSNPEVEKLVDLLFGKDKQPLFIDGSVPIREFLSDDGRDWLTPSDFLQKASEAFELKLFEAQLELTIPQLADHIGFNKAANRRSTET